MTTTHELTRVVFFGTHTFAATILTGLLENSSISVALVITQPDRPVGRKQEIQPLPVKLLALRHKLPVEQPRSLKHFDLLNESFDLGITAQYGGLIPKKILQAPRYGILNVHTSLLPAYRGASPIQSAIMNGDTETGITIIHMDEGLDTGPILAQKKITIEPDDTAPIVEQKLANLGTSLLLDTIPQFIHGKISPRPQDEARASYCQQLTRDNGHVDWSQTSTHIYNQYRGLTPWPGIWTTWNGQRIKLLHIRPCEKKNEPGFVSPHGENFIIGCGHGSVEVFKLQLEGKQPTDAKTFLHGHRTCIHDRLV